MSWAGPLALLLVITGSLIELDRECVFLKIQHAYDDASGVHIRNDECLVEPIWSDVYNEPENCSIYEVLHGYRGDENVPIFPIPDETMKTICAEENQNETLIILKKPEDEPMFYNSQAADVDKCYERLRQHPAEFMQLDDAMVEVSYVNVFDYKDNDTCPLREEIDYAFTSRHGNNSVQMQDPFTVDSERKSDEFDKYNATGFHNRFVEDSDNLDSEFLLLDTVNDDPDNVCDTKIQEDPVVYDFDSGNNTLFLNEPENEHNSFTKDLNTKESLSIIGKVMNVLFDHGIEPVQACWNDNWLKYLRKYIRDVKWVLKNGDLLVKYVSESLFSVFIKISCKVCDYQFYLSVVNFEMFEYIWLSVQNSNLDITAHGLAMYDISVCRFSEICIVGEKIRLSIRHFMHDKDYRFNYFWYVFHTTSCSLILILFYLTIKKTSFLMAQGFHFVSIVVRKIFQKSKRVNVAVATDTCNMSLIHVKHDVLRNLREVRETESERLEELKDLENQLDYARELTRWSNMKSEALEEKLKLLRVRATEAGTESPAEGEEVESVEV